ncbi:MAG TPA: hypothetical protein VN670_06635 [Acidobacteriaceae bacterium]|nr:hypothetical protein [Acidobacteriaceae bacterium]
MVTCVTTPVKAVSEQFQRRYLLKKMCSFPAMLVVLLATVVFLVLQKTIADPDICWHLRNAEVFFHTHSFLRQDLYSFTTRGKPWVDSEWLAEIPFYLGQRWFGPHGVFAVELVAIETVLLGIFGLGHLQSKNVKASFVVAFLAIFLADVSFGPRTLLFGWICLVVELAILYRFEMGLKQGQGNATSFDFTAWLPLLFLFWVNLHGSWMIGLVLLVLFVGCGWVEGTWGLIAAKRWPKPQRRKLLWVSGLSVLALFCNPYGWRLPAYPFDMAFRQKLNIANVAEWRSVDFHSPRGKIVLAVMAGTILLQLFRRRKWMLHEIAFLLLGFYAALTYSRFLFLAAILILPLLAKDLAEWMPYHAEREKPWLNLPIMAGLAATIVCLFPTNRRLTSAWSKEYPQEALGALQRFHPNGNVFTQYEWGGYLIWNVRQAPVFVDSRVDIFEHNGVLADYLNAVQLKDTYRIFDKYSIRYVLFQKDAPLSYLLRNTPGWRIDYQDKTAVLFEKTAVLVKETK